MGQNAFIVDTPWSESDTEKLVSWIKSQGLEIIGSLSTHSHEDRTAGIEFLNAKSIPTYASNSTNFILRNQNKATATNSFSAERVSLADGSIEAFYPGPGHTVDNLVVWLPDYNILYGGCFVRSENSKGLGYTGEAFVDQWPDS
ncbi:UNVERIFIED_CONTAM: hypothetical protein GTU68_000136, partial [Idotea baltica]|nr:hypothetical protein [Idotea baltica]